MIARFESCEFAVFIPVCVHLINLYLILSCALMGEKNKRRMYIAYYHRTPTPSLPAKYHTSLLMVPKNSTMMSKESWRYHVVDRLAMDGDSSEGVWIFEARKSYSRSTRLAGVLLLGKVPHSASDQDIETILRSVPMKGTVAEDPSWRCRHWVWKALDVSLSLD